MKLMVLTNQAGEIIATYQPTTGAGNALGKTWITTIDGHMAHEVEAPDNLVNPEALIKLHNTHVVKVIDKTAKLVERNAVKK